MIPRISEDEEANLRQRTHSFSSSSSSTTASQNQSPSITSTLPPQFPAQPSLTSLTTTHHQNNNFSILDKQPLVVHTLIQDDEGEEDGEKTKLKSGEETKEQEEGGDDEKKIKKEINNRDPTFSFSLFKVFEFPQETGPRTFFKAVKKMTRQFWEAFTAQIFYFIGNTITLMIFGMNNSAEDLAAVGAAQSTLNITALSIAIGFCCLLDGEVATSFGKNPTSTNREAGEKIQLTLALAILICCPFAYLLHRPEATVEFIFGKIYVKTSSEMLRASVAFLFLNTISFTFYSATRAQQRSDVSAKATAVSAVVVCCCANYIVKTFGPAGVAYCMALNSFCSLVVTIGFGVYERWRGFDALPASSPVSLPDSESAASSSSSSSEQATPSMTSATSISTSVVVGEADVVMRDDDNLDGEDEDEDEDENSDSDEEEQGEQGKDGEQSKKKKKNKKNTTQVEKRRPPLLFYQVSWIPTVDNCRRVFECSRVIQIFRLGISSMMAVMSEWLAFEVLLIVASKLGPKQLAAFAVFFQVLVVCFSAPSAIGACASSFVGKELGRNRPASSFTFARVCYFCAICGAIVNTAVVSVFHRFIFSLYTNDEEVIGHLKGVLLIFLFFHISDSTQFVINCAFRGASQQEGAVPIVLFGLWGVGLPCSWLFTSVLGGELPALLFGFLLGLLTEIPLLLWKSSKWNWRELAAERSAAKAEEKMIKKNSSSPLSSRQVSIELQDIEARQEVVVVGAAGVEAGSLEHNNKNENSTSCVS